MSSHRIPPVTDRNEDGSVEPAPFFTYGEPCENCGTACDAGTRVWVPGFNYFACDQCAEEARITIFAEDNCPALYRVILRARKVSEVQRAFQWHKSNCLKCNPKLNALPVRREVGREQKRERAA